MGLLSFLRYVANALEWAHIRELVEDTVGPFMTIGSSFQHQERAHISVSAAFLRRSGGPIHCHWQYFYPQEWAHTRESVVSLTSYGGPTQVYQQHFSGEVVGPFIAIGSILIHKNGPIQESR